MHRYCRALLVMLVVCLPAAALAESSPDAVKWLEKMAGTFEKAPLRFGFDADSQVEQMGQTMDMNMTGKMTYADPRHVRMDLDMKISAPGMPQAIDMSMFSVSDGTYMWMEMENPMMGGIQAMKIDLDKAGQLNQAGGMGNPAEMDPVSQIQDLVTKYDIEVVEVSGGKVTLKGVMTEAAKQELQASGGQAEGAEHLVLVLDESNAFPVEMRVGSPQPTVTMRFTEVEFVDKDSLDPALFSYTPPEGVQVMDLGAMVGQ